jgi:hypothetical protein
MTRVDEKEYLYVNCTFSLSLSQFQVILSNNYFANLCRQSYPVIFFFFFWLIKSEDEKRLHY